MRILSTVRQAVVVATVAALTIGIASMAYATENPPQGGVAPPITSTAPDLSPDEPVETVAPESELTSGDRVVATDPEALAYLLNCHPRLFADKPHISRDGSGQLSSHGTWESGLCRDKRGSIAIHLQAFFSDHTWRSRGVMGFSTVRPGGGAGKRATARVQCLSPKPVSWKAWAVIHTPSGGTASKYSNGTTINCADD